MAGLAAELGPIRPEAFLPIAELSVMRVLVTTRTRFVVKVKRNDFVFSAARSDFMAFGATHGGVRSGQRELGLPMLRDGIQSAVPIRHRMAALAAVLKRRFRKLAVVGIFVAVRTGRKLNFVNGLFAGRKVALVAFHFCVLAFERILGSRMFLDAKRGRLPSLHFVAFGTLPFLRAVGELAVVNVLVAVRAVRKLERALELPFCMASNATHLKVLADEGIFCLGMVELELRLDLFPSLRRVAILTPFWLKSSMVRVHMTIGAVLKLHAPETDGLREVRLVALLARHLHMQAGQGVARLGVIEILVKLGVLPVVYVVTVLALLSKPSLVVVLMTGHALGGRTEKGGSGILSFQEPADLREHVSGRMALFTFDTGMFALQGITGEAMIELFL